MWHVRLATARRSPTSPGARRITVLLIVFLVVLVLLATGMPVQTTLAVVGGAGLLAAEIATRLLGPAITLPEQPCGALPAGTDEGTR